MVINFFSAGLRRLKGMGKSFFLAEADPQSGGIANYTRFYTRFLCSISQAIIIYFCVAIKYFWLHLKIY